MRRRKFIALIGSAAAAWPVVALGQQGQLLRRIGMLTTLSESDSEGRARDEAFITELRQLGWAEGVNMQIDRRFTDGDAGLARQYAQELVVLAPEVILTTGSSGLVPYCR
jgi:putative tryptophan/tyrosine transport system substrate-binding protein